MTLLFRRNEKQHGCKHTARGFTLVELLVVIAIIGLLVAMLLPALGSVRESARASLCKSNLKQLGLAMQTYESGRGSFPPGRYGEGGWSTQALITPFLDQGYLYENIDFSKSYKEVLFEGMSIAGHRVPILNCPSERNTELRQSSGVTYAPINYAVNMGTWKVWDPNTQTGGDGMFHPNRGTRVREVRDGLSRTLLLSEVKTYNPYLRDGGGGDATPPTEPSEIAGLGGNFKTNSGHTEWVDGRVHQTGFTTTFAPNTVVSHQENGQAYDVDFNSQREGNSETGITYAAVTARSHHPGLVNVVTASGSVLAIEDDVDKLVWQALSTRQGRESTGDVLGP
jgi:prepilin-type N-terminal cleavage/methylation domain-containing protein